MKSSQLIKYIRGMSGSYSAHEIFSDWVCAAAIGISNSLSIFHNKIWKQREEHYLSIVRKYGKDNIVKFCEMTAMLTEILEEGPDDVLGYVYMNLEMGNKRGGQFFTPFHLSELAASMAISEEQLKQSDETILLNEPSCGGGGMIIAAAKALAAAGIDYQRRLEVIAQDIDWNSVYMCYLQLSLLGISAKVIQCNSLSDPKAFETDASHIFYTPAYVGVLV